MPIQTRIDANTYPRGENLCAKPKIDTCTYQIHAYTYQYIPQYIPHTYQYKIGLAHRFSPLGYVLACIGQVLVCIQSKYRTILSIQTNNLDMYWSVLWFVLACIEACIAQVLAGILASVGWYPLAELVCICVYWDI